MLKRNIFDVLSITIGCLLYALALTILALPNDLTEGGIPGAAIILHYAFDWSPGIVTFILTSVIMLVGFKYLAKRAMFLSLLTVPLISFFIYITEDFGQSLGDALTSAVFAGFFIGIGSGLIYKTGSSMGGTSLIALMLKKRFDWDMVRSIFVMDIIIVSSGLLVIGPLNVMYAIITLYIAKKATDLMMDGLNPRKAVSIISPHSSRIAEILINDERISVTLFQSKGGYKKEDTDMVYLIIDKFQLLKVKQVIERVDQDAFVVINDVREVFGGSYALK